MKRIALILIILTNLILSSCSEPSHASEQHEKDLEAADYVTVSFEGTNTKIATKDKNIPALQVLAACGVELNWDDDDHAHFTLAGTEFDVSVSSASMIEKGTKYNYIQAPPGTVNGFIESFGKEIYVDRATMVGILFQLGIGARIS